MPLGLAKSALPPGFCTMIRLLTFRKQCDEAQGAQKKNIFIHVSYVQRVPWFLGGGNGAEKEHENIKSSDNDTR